MALGLPQKGTCVADVASPSGRDSGQRALPWAASPLPQTHSPKPMFSQQTGRETLGARGLVIGRKHPATAWWVPGRQPAELHRLPHPLTHSPTSEDSGWPLWSTPGHWAREKLPLTGTGLPFPSPVRAGRTKAPGGFPWLPRRLTSVDGLGNIKPLTTLEGEVQSQLHWAKGKCHQAGAFCHLHSWAHDPIAPSTHLLLQPNHLPPPSPKDTCGYSEGPPGSPGIKFHPEILNHTHQIPFAYKVTYSQAPRIGVRTSFGAIIQPTTPHFPWAASVH